MKKTVNKNTEFELNLIELLWNQKFYIFVILIIFNLASISIYEIIPKKFNLDIKMDIQYDSINNDIVFKEFDIINDDQKIKLIDSKVIINNIKENEFNFYINKLEDFKKIIIDNLYEKSLLNLEVYSKVNQRNVDNNELVKQITQTMILIELIKSNKKIINLRDFNFYESISKYKIIFLGNIIGLLFGLLFSIFHKYYLFNKKK